MELASGPVGAGVELVSEALSLTSGIFKVEVSSTAGVGDGADEGDNCSSDFAAGSSKRRRIFGDSLRTTIFACFLILSARADAEGERPGVFEDDMTVDGVRKCCGETLVRFRGGKTKVGELVQAQV